MQKNQTAAELETELLKTLVEIEDLAEKKTKIYARLLMDVSIAKKMEELSLRHENRKETLYKLLYGECKKGSKNKNGRGMSEMKGEQDEDEA